MIYSRQDRAYCRITCEALPRNFAIYAHQLPKSASEMIDRLFLNTLAFTNMPEHQNSNAQSDRKSNSPSLSLSLSLSLSTLLEYVLRIMQQSSFRVVDSGLWTLHTDYVRRDCRPPTERVRISRRGARCHRGATAGNVCVLMLSILVLSIIRLDRCSITLPADTAR